jgi:hypothetical protein
MRNDSEIFRRILTGFVAEEDPFLSMPKWMMEKMMRIEAEQKVGAKKGVHRLNAEAISADTVPGGSIRD